MSTVPPDKPEKANLKSNEADKSPNGEVDETDVDLERTVKEYNRNVDALTGPELLAYFAKYNDDPILKRDGFVAAEVLPGEDAKEFENLVRGLFIDQQLEGEFQRRLGLVIAS